MSYYYNKIFNHFCIIVTDNCYKTIIIFYITRYYLF